MEIDLTIPDFLDRKNEACVMFEITMVPLGGAVKHPDGFIVRDCTNEE